MSNRVGEEVESSRGYMNLEVYVMIARPSALAVL